MKNIVVTKRIEPYDLIEGIKKSYSVEDFTFTGFNKFDVLATFSAKMKDLAADVVACGLYMKNVNKFYLITANVPVNEIEKNIKQNILYNVLGLTQSDLESENGIRYTADKDEAAEAVADQQAVVPPHA